jgi:condensation domain-containing protein
MTQPPVTSVLPLSAGQRAVWLGHRLAPDSAAYNVVVAVRVRSRLDVDVLARAVEAVAERHELLRSAFVELDGRPGRMLTDRARPRLELRELPDVGEERLRELARAVCAAPLQLAETGPLRVVLLRRGPDDAVLVVVAHHIAADASSQWLILRDLLDGYRGLADGGAPGWSVLPTTFSAHVEAERALLASKNVDQLANWWEQACAGVPAAELPVDRPRPAVRSGRGGTCELRLSAELAEGVRRGAAQLQTTPFGFLLGAIQTLLHRYTGRPDFAVGCPATLRSRPDLREVVGYLVNPLVVTAHFTAATTVRDAVVEAQRRLVEAMARARYPCALLPGPGGSRTAAPAPTFRITITQVDTDRLVPPLPMVPEGATEGPGIDYAGLRLHLYDLPQQEGQLDLSVSVLPHRGDLRLVFNYDADLFERASIERLARHLRRILETAVARPDTPVARLRLLERPEVNALLAMGTGPVVGA